VRLNFAYLLGVLKETFDSEREHEPGPFKVYAKALKTSFRPEETPRREQYRNNTAVV